ncbi:FHA domain-containing protein [Streptomyces sp. NPDC015131]|uniref:FHA domain-containing protein n=1 Tax=Streptomyces sp. NPDC015131 TaxID=3364941 RepID=UPI0036FB843B
MQIRLTVLAAPPGGQAAGRACDVLVTAPAGTALAAVASGLAAAVSGADPSGTVVLYAGGERLDPQRRFLGEPPLVDGAVLSLQVPGEDHAPPDGAAARLHVVAGPDAGGVHLLHPGRIGIGRSADADVPLDDPDVSRLHCAVTVADDGRVTVEDLGSTNGTTLDGSGVGGRPVRLSPGALLRLGESSLRLSVGPPLADGAPLPTAPDGEGHLRVSLGGTAPAPGAHVPDGGGPAGGGGAHRVPRQAAPPAPGGAGPAVTGGTVAVTPAGPPPGAPGTGGGAGSREATPPRGTPVGGAGGTGGPGSTGGTAGPGDDDGPGSTGADPAAPARKRGISAWARRLAGGRGGPADAPGVPAPAAPGGGALPETWPDPAAVLLTALGPGPRLWERGPGHPESLVVRLGTTDRADLAAVPVTVGLREAGSLGLAGPRARLLGLTRSVVAQLAALHTPAELEIVLLSGAQRRREWSWLGWLPHVRPARGQDCRLLLAYDREQAAARAAELTRRLDDGPLGPGWASADRRAVTEAAGLHGAEDGTYTVVIVDGDPGTAALRETTARLAAAGSAAGIHLICLAESPAASPLSPVADTYETACAASLAFRECGAAALLSGDVATALRLMRTVAGRPAGHGTVGTVDAVSAAWAERFARALAPLRAERDEPGGAAGGGPGAPGGAVPRGRAVAAPLPPSARLLDELGLARATPASLMARWASAPDGTAVLGTGPRGPLVVDLTAEGPHLLVEGPAGSGRTELLRSVAASLASASRPDRLGLLLVDGAGGGRDGGLAPCTELPHTVEHLVASDPVRMRDFAQALGAELKRRAELLGREDFAEWHTRREVADRMVAPRRPGDAAQPGSPRRPGDTAQPGSPRRPGDGTDPSGSPRRPGDAAQPGAPRRPGDTAQPGAPRRPGDGTDPSGGLDSPPSGTLRLRPAARGAQEEAPPPLPRLVVLVDDYDALVAPSLGSPGRPAAGSVVRALDAVARDGDRLGVHLVAASARPERTADTELAHRARLRVVLEPPPAAPGPDVPAPGRGRLGHPDGRVTPFQGGRVTGRIPRTATQRPTVVPLEWERMGDPPARRPVRELGNGPTDLALLASALERAARSVEAAPLPPLVPTRQT